MILQLFSLCHLWLEQGQHSDWNDQPITICIPFASGNGPMKSMKTDSNELTEFQMVQKVIHEFSGKQDNTEQTSWCLCTISGHWITDFWWYPMFLQLQNDHKVHLHVPMQKQQQQLSSSRLDLEPLWDKLFLDGWGETLKTFLRSMIASWSTSSLLDSGCSTILTSFSLDASFALERVTTANLVPSRCLSIRQQTTQWISNSVLTTWFAYYQKNEIQIISLTNVEPCCSCCCEEIVSYCDLLSL